MNEIVNKFLLVGDTFMPEMPGLIIVLVEHLLKIEKEFKSLKKQDILVIFTKMNQIKHDMAYGDFKDLTKKTIADKVLRDKTFKIASDQKYDGYQRGLASMVYKFF